MIRTFFIVILCMLFACHVYGQDLSIRAQQPERENLNQTLCKLIKVKMIQILSRSGIVDDDFSNRFVLTSKVNVLDKSIIGGSPSRVSAMIELTFIVGDIIENVKFGSYVITRRCIGENVNIAIRQAINTLNIEDEEFVFFLEQSKSRIIEYYKKNENAIIRKADVMVAESRYDDAISYLAKIPNASSICYDHCQEKMVQILRQKDEAESLHLFLTAKAEWAQCPDGEGAIRTCSLLSLIKPSTSCYDDAIAFLEEVKLKVLADEDREWALKMREYEDRMEMEKREFDARLAQDERNESIRRAEIEAARQIAVERARHQPDVSNNIILLW